VDMILWEQRVSSLLYQLTEQKHGHPFGANVLRDAASPTQLTELRRRLPGREDLADFYGRHDGLSWPDVWNGYFLHGLHLVLAADKRGEPNAVLGVDAGAILVLGSDGGGGRFAERLDSREIAYMPPGLVRQGGYDNSDRRTRIVSSDFGAFLERLADDLDAFVRDDRSWAFHGSPAAQLVQTSLEDAILQPRIALESFKEILDGTPQPVAMNEEF